MSDVNDTLLKIYPLCILILISIFSSTFAFSNVIQIPADYHTIQEGIDAALDGDMVLVANGTYKGLNNKNLDFKGKAIALTSENGAESTIIECEGDGRGFHFHSSENSESIVSGFTITHGSSEYDGGGIYCENSSSPTIENNIIESNLTDREGAGIACYENCSPIIQNNIIRLNSAYRDGGGISCRNYCAPIIRNNTIERNSSIIEDGGGIACNAICSPIIQDNVIEGNSAIDGEGGGIFCRDECFPTIQNNIIFQNLSWWGGGIQCCYDCYGIIQNNTIERNSAYCGGGIVCRLDSYGTIQNNTIKGNAAYGMGGGITCYQDSSPIIQNNIIRENSADSGGGGGISCSWDSCPIILNNLLEENSTKHCGGGIFLHSNNTPLMLANNIIARNEALQGGGIYVSNDSLLKLTNNTISDNFSSSWGGGLFCIGLSSVVVENTIFWGNIPHEVYLCEGSTIQITYSDIQGGWEGEGNINSDPLFVNSSNNDYHLSSASPCIDAGNNESLPEAIIWDLEGELRILDGDNDGIPIVDIGADEYLLQNIPPDAHAGPDQNVEANTSGGAYISLDSGSTDDGNIEPLTYTWTWGEDFTATGIHPNIFLPLGTTTVTLTVYDGQFSDSDEVDITVQDTISPIVNSVSVTPSELWPPNHKMVKVIVAIEAEDVCDNEPKSMIVSITGNEPVNGVGDGNSESDWEITGDLTANLRAERSGKGTGRTYRIYVECMDASGNIATSIVDVNVPHDQGRIKK